MSLTVCMFGNSMYYPEGGGHLWVYMNWALGMRAAGCRVIWLEGVAADTPIEKSVRLLGELKRRLARYGLAEQVALCPWAGGAALPAEVTWGCLSMEEASQADLLLNLCYSISPDIVRRFKRSALIDIDPGLLQIWMANGHIKPASHDVYFTIGETVGLKGGRIPDVGIRWNYTPPCVSLEHWPVHAAASDAPFTTVSHWYGNEWVAYGDELYRNDKRQGFLPYLEVNKLTRQPLELALRFGPGDDIEREMLAGKEWRFRESPVMAATPWEYQRYIQSSRGEFSCCKPSCVRLQNAWISDRTICYLASGKPAIVERTGPSRFLPDAGGLFRFGSPQEAARCLDAAAADYDHQCKLARVLAEEHFDARKLAAEVIAKAI